MCAGSCGPGNLHLINGLFVPLVGTVRDTVDALLPLLEPKTDSAHLARMTAHYRRTRARLDHLARPGRDGAPLHPQYVAATIDKVAARRTRCSPSTSAPRASGRPVICG